MDLSAVARHVQSRQELLVIMTPRALSRAVTAAEFTVITPGWFVRTHVWREWYIEQRTIARVIVASRAGHLAVGAVSHTSAAAVLGWPLFGIRPTRMHLSGPTLDGNVRSGTGIARHRASILGNTTDVEGLLITSALRTASDLVGSLPREAAVTLADAALRDVAWNARSHTYNQDSAEKWRATMMAAPALQAGRRGAIQARWVVEFADGRAQLPGESVSRLRLHQLGFAPPRLQVPVHLPRGNLAYIDFGLDDIDAWGEFDGEAKYTDADMRGVRSSADVLISEKWREDDIRGITGRRILRWGMAHIRTPQDLGNRLASFGVPHPLITRRVTR